MNLEVKHNNTTITNLTSGTITLNTADKYCVDELSFKLTGAADWDGSICTSTFTFLVRDSSTTYNFTAETSMTWLQFVNSSYNTNNKFSINNVNYVCFTNGSYSSIILGDGEIEDEEGEIIYISSPHVNTDEIYNNCVYTVSN